MYMLLSVACSRSRAHHLEDVGVSRKYTLRNKGYTMLGAPKFKLRMNNRSTKPLILEASYPLIGLKASSGPESFPQKLALVPLRIPETLSGVGVKRLEPMPSSLPAPHERLAGATRTRAHPNTRHPNTRPPETARPQDPQKPTQPKTPKIRGAFPAGQTSKTSAIIVAAVQLVGASPSWGHEQHEGGAGQLPGCVAAAEPVERHCEVTGGEDSCQVRRFVSASGARLAQSLCQNGCTGRWLHRHWSTRACSLRLVVVSHRACYGRNSGREWCGCVQRGSSLGLSRSEAHLRPPRSFFNSRASRRSGHVYAARLGVFVKPTREVTTIRRIAL